ncbi:MAG: peptidase M23 [Desulfobulbus propionicus]|nr:MAG: peptidase M23 [Desulfobulbus propionicus]PIE60613.1 MAG: peptidase M23 [Desulfobulbus propionicus]
MARRNRRRGISRSNKGGFLSKFFLILLVLIIAGGAGSAFILFETEQPTIEVAQKITFLGSSRELPISIADTKSGIRMVEVVLEQGQKNSQLFNRIFTRKAWFKDAGPKQVQETITINAQKAKFDEGQAHLIIRARDFSLNGLLQGNETITTIPVIIDTKPPKVIVTHSQRYLSPGKSGIVTYQLSEPVEQHGVQIDEQFYPGFPYDKSGKQFVSYIALPWNSAEPKLIKVIALDKAGNEGKAVFGIHFKAAQKKTDKINISNGFLKAKTPEFEQRYPEMTGTLINKYLFINNKVRQQNNATIKEVCSSPSDQRFWSGRFLRMPGAKRAGFADQRTYFYKGKPVDYQTHLGIDIASTARADIRAANSGKIIFADYLGIYGNVVIIDHGQGIYSLYSHLSRIDVAAGSMVTTDEHIGNSGTTGMAGGDHLHFSMLVHGIFVTPVEWWDQNWLTINIDDIVGAGPPSS